MVSAPTTDPADNRVIIGGLWKEVLWPESEGCWLVESEDLIRKEHFWKLNACEPMCVQFQSFQSVEPTIRQLTCRPKAHNMAMSSPVASSFNQPFDVQKRIDAENTDQTCAHQNSSVLGEGGWRGFVDEGRGAERVLPPPRDGDGDVGNPTAACLLCEEERRAEDGVSGVEEEG